MSNNGEHIEALWEKFSTVLQQSIDNHIPHKNTKKKDSFPWITKEIKQKIKRRDRMYQKKKKSNDPVHISNFKKAKQEVGPTKEAPSSILGLYI